VGVARRSLGVVLERLEQRSALSDGHPFDLGRTVQVEVERLPPGDLVGSPVMTKPESITCRSSAYLSDLPSLARPTGSLIGPISAAIARA
jgi:hypothetical protein